MKGKPGLQPVVQELVARRRKLGLSQQNVADRIFVTAASVSMFETGYRPPLLSTVVRYANAVGATITIQETP